MPQLDYATPQPPPRSNAGIFWTLYMGGGLASAYTTDIVLHVGHRPSDGGCFWLGIYSLVLLALAVEYARRAIMRRWAAAFWSGALIGVLVPPSALGLLIGTRII
jgi:hypothetical protein